MKMALQILSTEMIKPSVPTPHHLRSFKLSFLDQIAPSFYVPLTFFYDSKFNLSSTNISEIHHHIKCSLKETLTIFYPLAGRIRDPATIDCNDEGVHYTEAFAPFTLSEFLLEPDINALHKFLPLHANVVTDSKDLPMSIQVTILGCGGVVIGVCWSHLFCDLATMAPFLRSWAEIFKGKGDKEVKINALGSSFFPPLSPFPDDYESLFNTYFFAKENHSTARRFVFDVSSIATLRAKATSANVPNPTRIEAMTGFITERLMEGYESRSMEPLTSLTISHVVDLRRRLDPPSPDTIFGNIFSFASASYTPSSPKKEMHEYVETLRKALHGMNSETLATFDQRQFTSREISELPDKIKNMASNPVFRFTSWCNRGLYDLDFGWGKPCWVAHMGDVADGGRTVHKFLFLEGKGGGEIELWAILDEDDMAMLENDQEFTAFATPNPSIPLNLD